MYCIMRKRSDGSNEFMSHNSSKGYFVTSTHQNSVMCLYANFEKAYKEHEVIMKQHDLGDMYVAQIKFEKVDTNIIRENFDRVTNKLEQLKLQIEKEEAKLKTILSSPTGLQSVEWDAPVSEDGANDAVARYICEQVYLGKSDPSIYRDDVLVVKPNGYVHNRTHNMKKFDVTVTVTDSIVALARQFLKSKQANEILSFI